jgi:hypothetical protein
MDLCKKQSYTIDHAQGEGNDNHEATFIACFMNSQNRGQAEENSTWLKFEIKQSGSLTFTITPQVPTDDIDFVVYKLPANGDCSKKVIVRCMAAGPQVLDNGDLYSGCMGPTGLRDGETDTSEDAGCKDPGDNAWLAPLKVTKGEKYALLVSNVTTSGPGFSINFGGTAKFPCDEEPPKKEPKVKKTPPVVIADHPKPKKVIPAVIEPPATIGGRTVRVAKSMDVRKNTITVIVWDSQVEDGDVISIYLNDRKVLSNIALTKKPKEYLVEVADGDNYLTVYSEDFGKVEPNTCALLIKDDDVQQEFLLKSTRDFQESIKVVKKKTE